MDTSSSMQQKTEKGISFLDLAKTTVEKFINSRNHNITRNDRYMLLTCEEGIKGIKVGWKRGYPFFLEQLKHLEAQDLTEIGEGLKKSFMLLNQGRIQRNIDNYGQGRYPFYLESSCIILLTDGNEYTGKTCSNNNVNIFKGIY